MYAPLDAAALAVERALPYVLADREAFRPALAEAEAVAAEQGCVVARAAAARLLLAGPAPPGPDGYELEFYAADPLRAGREMARRVAALAPDGLTRYTHLATLQADREFALVVDERTLVRLYALPSTRGEPVFDLVRHAGIERPGPFSGRPLVCANIELCLADTYRRLCDPAAADEWDALEADEARLRRLFLTEGDATVGGAPAPRPPLARLLREGFLPGEGRVLVGGAGTGRLQVATAAPLRDEEREVRRLLRQHEPQANVQAVLNNPSHPSDPRLRRMTLYLVRPGAARLPFLDLYNCAAYDLVPFVAHGVDGSMVRVGTPPVQARFLLIDRWVLRLLHQIGAVGDAYAQEQLDLRLLEYARVAERLPERPPPDPAAYAGARVDEQLAAKREALRRRQAGPRRPFHPPFFPLRPAGEKTGGESP